MRTTVIPDALGGRHDYPELGLFVGSGESVAEDGSGEPALHKPEDDGRVLWYRGQWLESTGALVVVFQEQPLGAHVWERALREPVVAALDQPAALLVTAAKMETERNAGTLSEDNVVELEPALGWPAAAGVEVTIGGIEEEWIVGSVELDLGPRPQRTSTGT